MLLIESAVRDFGVGLVCIGGDQSFAAGGYRNTRSSGRCRLAWNSTARRCCRPAQRWCC